MPISYSDNDRNNVMEIANDVMDDQFITEYERTILAMEFLRIVSMAENCDADPICSTCHIIGREHGSY
jgi:hypothetical protein